MRIFITGAAGPLGRAVTTMLTARGDTVVGQVRRLSGVALMEKLGAEPFVGDIRRPDRLANAMKNCDVLLHLASFFDFWAPQSEIFRQVNVDGTKHALAAAIIAGVQRVVMCSSAVTIGEVPGEQGNEWTRHRGFTVTELERSRLEAERLAQRMRSRGIQVITVNPALVLAPADPGWTGRLITAAVCGRARMAGSAPMGWVWVGDAAFGIIRAMLKGRDGERYILCGETESLRDRLGKMAQLAGQRGPMTLPSGLMRGSAAVASALALPFHTRPMLSRDESRFTTTGFRVDGSHAVRELGVRYTPSSAYLPTLVEGYRRAAERFS